MYIWVIFLEKIYSSKVCFQRTPPLFRRRCATLAVISKLYLTEQPLHYFFGPRINLCLRYFLFGLTLGQNPTQPNPAQPNLTQSKPTEPNQIQLKLNQTLPDPVQPKSTQLNRTKPKSKSAILTLQLQVVFCSVFYLV